MWPGLLVMLGLATLLNRLDFFWIVERRAGIYDRWSVPLSGLVTCSAALLFGPTAIWVGVITTLVSWQVSMGRCDSPSRWSGRAYGALASVSNVLNLIE